MTHTDGFTLYWPTGPAPEVFHYNQPAFKAMMLNFSDHMHAMSNTLVPASYPLSTDPPIITSLECKVRLELRLDQLMRSISHFQSEKEKELQPTRTAF